MVTGVVNDKVNANAVITATAMDGSNVYETFNVTVKQIVPPETVTIDQTYSAENNYLFAIADKKIELTFSTYPEECTLSLIEWKSSDETIATVESGVVTFNQNGIFGDVTITATCPETGNSSDIKLHLEEGLIRELFDDPDNITWSVVNGGNKLPDNLEWHEEGNATYVTVKTYTVNETTQRGDFKCNSPKVWINANNYPLIAVRWHDVKEQGDSRNINLDTSGTCNGSQYSGNVGGSNNKWAHEYKCDDGTYVYVYDLSSQTFATGGLLPNNALAEFTTFQFKYADIKTATEPVSYNVYWIQSFKRLADIEAYIKSEGLTFEKTK